MNILQITPEAPGYYSGGRLGVLQTKESIVCDKNTVDYIGPYIENDELREGYRNLYFLDKNKNVIKQILYLIEGITNKSYEYWKKLDINYDDYDCVVLDFTKQDYVLKKIDSSKLFVRVHNVEYDFSKRAFELSKKPKDFIFKILAHRQEGRLIKAAKKTIALTENDKSRLIELYKIDGSKIEIVPVCTKISQPAIKNNGKTMIITGSLWFGGNYEGIKWFINEVFDKLDSSYHLIIAGSKPNDSLKKLVKDRKNIDLIANPVNMGDYFTKASIAIAPVFDGAGMKVKVAEALSYGLPVIATDHALTGYDIITGQNSFRANTSDEFLEAIQYYFSMDNNSIIEFRKRAVLLHEKDYSLDCSRDKWKNILREN